jgi:hypothetical protein
MNDQARLKRQKTPLPKNHATPLQPGLAAEQRILDRMAADLARAGLVGEVRAAKLVYLLLTSRFLDRPLCAVIKGQSSAGKNTVVDRVLALFPASAFHTYTSMSTMFMAYDTEPLSHRILVIAEAAGLAGGQGAYLVRSLISEGRLIHGTVESTTEGFRSRRIEREGPTGLLVTTTALKLEAELETRMLSIPINDSPEQTSAILMSRAGRWDGSRSVVPVDPAPWHALQTWLESAEHRVVIPYARSLTNAIPPVAVRLRRDVDTLLSLIAAHALLHQAQRERDPEGRIIATLEDYGAVYVLIVDLVSEGVGASVSETVRETVEAVHDLGAGGALTFSLDQIGKKLGLDDRTTIWRHVKGAVRLGYLRNLEERRGMPAKITLGEPLPEEVEVLPRPEHLAGDRCSVAA